jgi:scyllo-inositol 2-dehydrogenase (NADP+)
MSEIRVGVIGMGLFWNKVHKPIFEKLSDSLMICAFCSTNPVKKRELEKKYPSVPSFDNYESLVSAPEIDAVLVMTPIPLNAPVTMAALKAGKDVFVEKPMALNVKDCERIIALEKETGKTVYPLEQYVYSGKYDKILEVINSGEIGEVVYYDMLSHFFIDESQGQLIDYGTTKWRIDSEFPLGTIYDGGVHDFALLGKMFGCPKSVYATGSKLRPGFGEYDHLLMSFVYSDKFKASVSHSGYLGGHRGYFYIRGTMGLIVVEDSRIIVEAKNGESRIIEIAEENLSEKVWLDIIRAKSEGTTATFTSNDAVLGIKILESIEKSVRSGNKVDIL